MKIIASAFTNIDKSIVSRLYVSIKALNHTKYVRKVQNGPINSKYIPPIYAAKRILTGLQSISIAQKEIPISNGILYWKSKDAPSINSSDIFPDFLLSFFACPLFFLFISFEFSFFHKKNYTCINRALRKSGWKMSPVNVLHVCQSVYVM